MIGAGKPMLQLTQITKPGRRLITRIRILLVVPRRKIHQPIHNVKGPAAAVHSYSSVGQYV